MRERVDELRDQLDEMRVKVRQAEAQVEAARDHVRWIRHEYGRNCAQWKATITAMAGANVIAFLFTML